MRSEGGIGARSVSSTAAARGGGGGEMPSLALRKRIARRAEFLYRQPILTSVQGGDADAVYYAAPVDLLHFFRSRGADLVTTSADVRFGPLGRLVPVELQGSTVLAWRVGTAPAPQGQRPGTTRLPGRSGDRA